MVKLYSVLRARRSEELIKRVNEFMITHREYSNLNIKASFRNFIMLISKLTHPYDDSNLIFGVIDRFYILSNQELSLTPYISHENNFHPRLNLDLIVYLQGEDLKNCLIQWCLLTGTDKGDNRIQDKIILTLPR